MEINFLETESLIDISLEKEEKEEEKGRMRTFDGKCAGKSKWVFFFFLFSLPSLERHAATSLV